MTIVTDLTELIIELLLKCQKLFQKENNRTRNLNMAFAQFSRIFLVLFVFFSSQYDAEQIKFSLFIKSEDGKISLIINYDLIIIASLINQIHLILFERQIVFQDYSYTFERIVFFKLIGLTQNIIIILHINNQEDISSILKKLGNKNYSINQVYAILFLTNLFLDILELIINTYRKCCSKSLELEDYSEEGGLKYFLLGFIFGMAFPICICILHYFSQIKDKEQEKSYIITFYANSISLGIQLILVPFYVPQARKEKEICETKCIMSWVYGISFGIMNLYNSGLVVFMLSIHFIAKTLFCQWPEKRKKKNLCGLEFLYCCTPDSG